MPAARSVLLSSNYEAWPEAFNGQAYAFLNVVRSLEHADVLCPPAAAYASGRGVNPSVSYLLNELSYAAYPRCAACAANRPHPMRNGARLRAITICFSTCASFLES